MTKMKKKYIQQLVPFPFFLLQCDHTNRDHSDNILRQILKLASLKSRSEE